jgi:transcriptional regulator with XRE-family HTH domain
LNYKPVLWHDGSVAKTPGAVPPAPNLENLLANGIPRDRALLAVRVGELRVQQGWTYHVLGQHVTMNGTYLRRLEEGKHDLGLDRMLRLAHVFELSSLEQLFGHLPTEPLIRTNRCDDGVGQGADFAFATAPCRPSDSRSS